VSKMNVEFTDEVKQQVLSEQNYRCARCGACLYSDIAPSFHHKKCRSFLTRAEIEEHGPGGGRLNCVALCCDSHAAVHAYAKGTERFRTRSYQKIGRTEEDL